MKQQENIMNVVEELLNRIQGKLLNEGERKDMSFIPYKKKIRDMVRKYIYSYGGFKLEGIWWTDQKGNVSLNILDLTDDPNSNDIDSDDYEPWSSMKRVDKNGIYDFAVYELGSYGDRIDDIIVEFKDGKLIGAWKTAYRHEKNFIEEFE